MNIDTFTLTFIAIWLFAGLVTDFVIVWLLARRENLYWDEWCKNAKVDRHLITNYTTLDMAKETPWWAHLIMIILPFSGFLRL